MSITLTDLRARLAQYLLDSGGLVYATDALDEALRSALGEYNLWAAPAAACALSGLDGAAATTLPDAHVTLLMTAAAGYAAVARAGRREEMHNLAGVSAQALQGWGVMHLEDFRTRMPAALESARQTGLQNASNPPFPADSTLDGWKVDRGDGGRG